MSYALLDCSDNLSACDAELAIVGQARESCEDEQYATWQVVGALVGAAIVGGAVGVAVGVPLGIAAGR